MTTHEFALRLQHACASVMAAEQELTEIDSKFGDADHGLTMTKIAKAISAAVEASDGGIQTMLDDAAMAASSSMVWMPPSEASTAAEMAFAILVIVSPWSASPNFESISVSSCSAAITDAQACCSRSANSCVVIKIHLLRIAMFVTFVHKT